MGASETAGMPGTGLVTSRASVALRLQQGVLAFLLLVLFSFILAMVVEQRVDHLPPLLGACGGLLVLSGWGMIVFRREHARLLLARRRRWSARPGAWTPLALRLGSATFVTRRSWLNPLLLTRVTPEGVRQRGWLLAGVGATLVVAGLVSSFLTR